VPGVLLLHGLSSHKERMANAIGRSLLQRGVASLALDLPMHGERSGNGKNVFGNPLALVGAWRTAVREAEDAVTGMSGQHDVDAARIGVVGYSLGGFLALMAAAEDPRLRVITLAAAGDLPDATPYAALIRSIVDPPRAAKRLDGRPLLMVNGRRDTTTRPPQAERLFAAALEPKTMLWYPGGHWPPDATIDKAAEWTATRLRALEDTTGGSRRVG
jgi:fermentation-respiration switch protein FrsA (DUF1100 family)